MNTGKPILVVLHGALGDATQMDGLLSCLPDHYTVITYNFPGHGGRDCLSVSASVESYTEDLVQFLEAQQLSKIDVLGYSLGGYVALWLAAKYPNYFRRIITLATKFDWNLDFAAGEAARLNPEKLLQKVPEFAQQLQKRHGIEKWETTLQETATLMLKLGKQPLLTKEILSRIQLPVCISVGDRDKMVRLDESISVYQALPKGQFCVIPNCPHPIEQMPHPIIAALFSWFLSN
ncbi:MAG: alpha/beta hydrolase [Bacteroidia bacterium]|nr:alpha/beta hydrolase [Bacteroidia bacterium]